MSAALNDANSFKITCVVTKGPHKGQTFVFSKDLITIGRGQDNDVVLVNDPMVSRNHCHITVVNNEVEIHNLSQKNTLFIEGESVQKWKLLNSSFFSIGDTEITLEIDFGARVVQQTSHSQSPSKSQPDHERTSISSLKNPLSLVQDQFSENSIISDEAIENRIAEKEKEREQKAIAKIEKQREKDKENDRQLAVKKPKLQPPQTAQQSQVKPYTPANDFKNYQQPYAIRDAGVKQDKPIAFYLILGIVALAAIFLLLDPNKAQKTAKDKKPTTLKYEDEVVLQLNSKNEKQVEAELRKKYDQKNSAMALRAEENFMKGMREFQLGQYARAQEFLQVVLNLNPGHDVATKYLKLARIRFDEVLKAKLVLGETSYQKHNFKMCASQYLQIMNMLEGRNRDETYRLAESWYKKCEYAAQGIM